MEKMKFAKDDTITKIGQQKKLWHCWWLYSDMSEALISQTDSNLARAHIKIARALTLTPLTHNLSFPSLEILTITFESSRHLSVKRTFHFSSAQIWVKDTLLCFLCDRPYFFFSLLHFADCQHKPISSPQSWPNLGHILVKYCQNCGHILVKVWPNLGHILAAK